MTCASVSTYYHIMPPQPSTIDYLPLNCLRFDPLNPRLPSTVVGSNERAVLDYLLKEEALIELMGSIGELGYFAGEPLLVSPSDTEENVYWVIEGNRRFASVKLLNHPELASTTNKLGVQAASKEAKFKPVELPAVVYPTRKSILDYLSYRHITGIKAWNPLQKAKYLSQLRDQVLQMPLGEQFRSLAKSIGTRSDYVARLLTGYGIYKEISDHDFYNIPRLDETSLSFSVLTTALTYSNIRQFIGLESNDDPTVPTLKKPELKELTDWMFRPNSENKTRLGDSRNLKYLSEVVANEKAIAAFRNGTPLISAKDLTQEPSSLFRLSISQSRTKLITARDTLHLIETLMAADEDALAEIQALTRDIRAVVRAKVFAAEDIG